MEIRDIFNKMLGKQQVSREVEKSRIRFMNGFTPIFTSFGSNAYDSDTVRSAVHAIANNAAKLKATHVKRKEGQMSREQDKLEQLLTIRPNAHMNAFDFLYKLITQTLMRSNGFALIQYNDNRQIVGFYPINYSSVEFLQTPDDELYVQFKFNTGKQLTVHYNDVIHLRRFFNESDFYGESNATALMPTLELIHASNEGIINAIKSSAQLRGLLKFTNSMLKDEDVKKQRDDFVNDYMDMQNNGGIAALDGKAEYHELSTDPKMVDDKQMELIHQKVYRFFNINESIVESNYTEDEWNAFYESVLEPIAIQLSLEFTSKVFTERELSRGHEIVFEANRLQYASMESKTRIVETLMPLGLMSKNEAREVFNLAPIEDGEKHVMSLNYIDADKASEYQVNKAKGGDGNGQNRTARTDDAEY